MGRKPIRQLMEEVGLSEEEPPKKTKSDIKRMGGVYVLIRDGKVLYIGETSHLLNRLSSHHYGFGAQVIFAKCSDPDKRLKVEAELIRKYKPPFNGENYPQIIHTVPLENIIGILNSKYLID